MGSFFPKSSGFVRKMVKVLRKMAFTTTTGVIELMCMCDMVSVLDMSSEMTIRSEGLANLGFFV